MPLMLNGQRTRRVHGWSFSTHQCDAQGLNGRLETYDADFGEVENLQVTRKGSADFVSQADISAERTIQPSWQRLDQTGALSWKKQVRLMPQIKMPLLDH